MLDNKIVCLSILGVVLLMSCSKSNETNNTPIISTGEISYNCKIIEHEESMDAILNKTEELPKLDVDSLLTISNIAASNCTVTTYYAFESMMNMHFLLSNQQFVKENEMLVGRDNSYGDYDDRYYNCILVSDNERVYYFAFITGLDYATEDTYRDLLFNANDVEMATAHFEINQHCDEPPTIIDKDLTNEQIAELCIALQSQKYLHSIRSDDTPGSSNCSFTISFKNGNNVVFNYRDDGQLFYNNNIFKLTGGYMFEVFYNIIDG